MSNYSGQIFLKRYIRLLHETILVRHRYVIGKENFPARNERCIVVCNHQNTANDPINIILSLPFDLRLFVLARANVFSVHPLITKFLYWLGLLPAYRAGWEGDEAVGKNMESFDIVADKVNNFQPVVIYPEAGHTQGHYLDPFTTGAVKMAFHAASKNNWQEDIKIVPTAHHYSDYFEMRSDFIWSIAEPVSLKPYYQEYQEHPYRVLRRLTRQLRETVQSMILDEGKDDYEERDFLRCSALNPATLKHISLPERLKEDQAFCRKMTTDNPHYVETINAAAELRYKEQSLSIDDATVEQQPTKARALGQSLILLLLLPLWIVSLWPQALCYWLPTLLLKTDRMFTNSYRFILALLVLYPIFALLTLFIMGFAFGWWWQALVWILLWFQISKFSWWYWKLCKKTQMAYRYNMADSQALADIQQLREKLRNWL